MARVGGGMDADGAALAARATGLLFFIFFEPAFTIRARVVRRGGLQCGVASNTVRFESWWTSFASSVSCLPSSSWGCAACSLRTRAY